MSTTTLIIWIFAGAIGTGYFVYGKKQQMAMPIICGIILCFYPYFTDNIWLLCSIGTIFTALPFFLKF